MQIAEVSEILGLCHFLRAPKHVFITGEKVSDEENTFFRGIQPKLKDAILLSAQADRSTPIHEAVHVYGIDEIGTEILTRLIMTKNRVLNRFPMIAGLRRKEVVYDEVHSSTEYPEAHQGKFKGRIQHFVLRNKL